jgi:zinc transporter ZupT
MFLVLSLIGLAAGPLVAWVARDRPTAFAWVLGLLLLATVGVAVAHVLPHAVRELGVWAVLPLALGLLLPTWIERARASNALWITLVLVVGLAVHAVIDGTALNTHEGHHHAREASGDALALAISLHRVPEGIVVFLLISPRYGTRWAYLALSLVGVASVAGFYLSEALIDRLPGSGPAALETFIVGSLLHVLAHQDLPDKASSSFTRVASWIRDRRGRTD